MKFLNNLRLFLYIFIESLIFICYLLKIFIKEVYNAIITRKYINFKYLFIKIFFIIFLAVSSFITYCLWDLPDYRKLTDYKPSLITNIYSEDNYIIAEFATEKRLFVPISNISPYVKDAFISAEDKNFYSHWGIDVYGLARAFLNNILYYFGKSDNIEGASTISQQVVKNFLLNNDRTIRRKIREAILTFKVESKFSKDYILELYLNEIYLGKSSYGVSMASLNYFGKPVSDLTLEEGAFLAILPKAPSRYDPSVNYNLSKSRRDWVIGRMLIENKITKDQHDKAIEKPLLVKNRDNTKTLKTNYASEEIRKNLIKRIGYDKLYNGGLTVKTTINYKYQEYAHDVFKKGIMEYDQSLGYRTAYKIENLESYKNIDINEPSVKDSYKFIWQEILNNNSNFIKKEIITPWVYGIIISIEGGEITAGLQNGEVVKINLLDNAWVLKIQNSKKELTSFKQIFKSMDIILLENINNIWYIRQIPEVNGALIAMNPQNGEILAMQGGYSFAMSEFNRATQALRQPGSLIKPIIYLSALEKGYKNNDLILDAPYVFGEDKETWRPKNNMNLYRGFVTFRNALEYSRNLVTIRIANDIGLKRINEITSRLKIYNGDIDDLTVALGSKETTLLSMVRAYAILANGGKMVEPSLIQLIEDNQGNEIYANDARECPDCSGIIYNNQLPPQIEDSRPQVADQKDVFLIVNLMQGVVERGSGVRAKVNNYNIAGKTGTTNDVKDVWFIGFTPNLVVGIFIGADEPKSLGDENASATSIAVPIFKNFMIKALQDRDNLPFRVPEGIVMKWINYKTGKINSKNDEEQNILEAFREDNLPSEQSNTSNLDVSDEDNNVENGLY